VNEERSKGESSFQLALEGEGVAVYHQFDVYIASSRCQQLASALSKLQVVISDLAHSSSPAWPLVELSGKLRKYEVGRG
jgi:hypothetical protein